MTQDEIIDMAYEVGFTPTDMNDGCSTLFEAFAKLVAEFIYKNDDMFTEAYAGGYAAGVAAERQACAKLCEVPDDLEDWEIICGNDGRELLNAMAAAIRARSISRGEA